MRLFLHQSSRLIFLDECFLLSCGPICSYFSHSYSCLSYSASRPTVTQKQRTNKRQVFWQRQKRQVTDRRGKQKTYIRITARGQTKTLVPFKFYYQSNTSLNQMFLDWRHICMGFVIATDSSGLGVHKTGNPGPPERLDCVQWPWCKHEKIVFPTKLAEIWTILVLQGKPSVFWKAEKPPATSITVYARNPNTPVTEEMK